MSTKTDYLELGERINRLNERRAVLEAREKEKAKAREALTQELKAAGINTDQPEQEAERLEREIQDELQQAKARVDQFERELEAAERGEEPPTTPAQKLGDDLAKKSIDHFEAEKSGTAALLDAKPAAKTTKPSAVPPLIKEETTAADDFSDLDIM